MSRPCPLKVVPADVDRKGACVWPCGDRGPLCVGGLVVGRVGGCSFATLELAIKLTKLVMDKMWSSSKKKLYPITVKWKKGEKPVNVYTRQNWHAIGHVYSSFRIRPGHVFNSTFVIFRWSFGSIRSELEKDPSHTLPAFWGHLSNKLDRNGQSCRFPHSNQYFCVLSIKHMNYNKDLKKLEYRLPKDFAIGRIFLEMFII